jgi:hypothetical protein
MGRKRREGMMTAGDVLGERENDGMRTMMRGDGGNEGYETGNHSGPLPPFKSQPRVFFNIDE